MDLAFVACLLECPELGSASLVVTSVHTADPMGITWCHGDIITTWCDHWH